MDGRSFVDLFSPLVIDGLCYAMARLNLAGKVLLGNVGITNVPGSPVPLYLAGAPLVTIVPMAPVLGAGIALTVTVASTDRHLLLGFHGDGAAIKDKELFVAGAARAFDKLRVLAGVPRSATRKLERTSRSARRGVQHLGSVRPLS